MGVGWLTGYDPATSSFTNSRSNQLSYNHRAALKSFISNEIPCFFVFQ
jgi:hypothetical protein